MATPGMSLPQDIVERARVMFVSGLHRGKPGFFLEEHDHPDWWQADWVLAGRLTYGIDGQEIAVASGEVLFIPPGLRHWLVSREGFTCRAIKFEVPAGSRSGGAIHARLAEETPLLALLAEQVFAPRQTLPWRMTGAYLGALMRLAEPNPSTGDTSARRTEDPLMRARQFALDRLHEPLTVRWLAAAACLSVSHFSRRFSQTVGVPPGRWIAWQRLLRAAELLQYADLSVTEITWAVGYVDLPTFSKAFKRWSGVAPREYRNWRARRLERT